MLSASKVFLKFKFCWNLEEPGRTTVSRARPVRLSIQLCAGSSTFSFVCTSKLQTQEEIVTSYTGVTVWVTV